MRSVDLSGLPRDARHFIAWNQSEGFDVPFHYDDQQGLLTILRAGKGNHGEAVLDIRYAGQLRQALYFRQDPSNAPFRFCYVAGAAVCGRPAGLYDFRSAPRAFKIQSQDDAARSSYPVFAVQR